MGIAWVWIARDERSGLRGPAPRPKCRALRLALSFYFVVGMRSFRDLGTILNSTGEGGPAFAVDLGVDGGDCPAVRR